MTCWSWVFIPEFLELIEYSSSRRCELPQLELNANGEIQEAEDEPLEDGYNRFTSDIDSELSAIDYHERWLNKTVEVLQEARNGYVELWESNRIQSDEKHRLSNVSTMISALVSVK